MITTKPVARLLFIASKLRKKNDAPSGAPSSCFSIQLAQSNNVTRRVILLPSLDTRNR
jgi:hypothetical protein